MIHKEKSLSGALSFLLPGLGQLYEKHVVRAVLFFGIFLTCLFFEKARLFLPIVAVFSAGEAYRSAQGSQNSSRNWTYSAIGFLGFLSWVAVFFPTVHGFADQALLNERAEYLASGIRQCQLKNGREAVTLDLCFADKAVTLDPWGTQYHFSITLPEGFEIESAGRDKQFKTADDYVYHYR